MARTKLAIDDQFLVWAATAPVGEVEAQYRRVGAVLAQRRAGTKPTRKKAAKSNGLDKTPMSFSTVTGLDKPTNY